MDRSNTESEQVKQVKQDPVEAFQLNMLRSHQPSSSTPFGKSCSGWTLVRHVSADLPSPERSAVVVLQRSSHVPFFRLPVQIVEPACYRAICSKSLAVPCPVQLQFPQLSFESKPEPKALLFFSPKNKRKTAYRRVVEGNGHYIYCTA